MNRFALFNLGFRPFFLGAAIFSVVATATWMAIFVFGIRLLPFAIPAITWHAHEMIFGYALAVIAGFLLTAVRNWTGMQTPHGLALASLFLLWIAGRIAPFLAQMIDIWIIGLVDCLFVFLVFVTVTIPIVRKKQWKNIGITILLLPILAANAVYYLGLSGASEKGTNWGLYSGFYLVLALIFVMGRRVIPFFIERGVDEQVQPRNYRWLDNSSLILFLLFAILESFAAYPYMAAGLAFVLFVLHSIRLAGWYTPGIWRKPLLWVLYIAYSWLVAGFLFKAAAPVFHISPYLGVHAFAFGGIGMMTIGMMSRVSLGHTGRNIQQPPALLNSIFMMLCAAAIVRVVFPLLAPNPYNIWIGLSQILWILAFAGFTLIYTPLLIRPRADGSPG